MATQAPFSQSMASQTNLRTALFPTPKKKPFIVFTFQQRRSTSTSKKNNRSSEIRVSASNGDSYLDLWKRASDRERKEILFRQVAMNSATKDEEEEKEGTNQHDLEKKTEEFNKLLEVPKEERDRVQRIQVIDRASAAIAAARALIKESPPPSMADSKFSDVDLSKIDKNVTMGIQEEGTKDGDVFISQSVTSGRETPGPDFWSWTPPLDVNNTSEDISNLQTSGKPAPSPSPNPVIPVMEKERTTDVLVIPFESTKSDGHNPPLPPLQSLMEVEKLNVADSISEQHTLSEEPKLDTMFSTKAAEAAEALHKVDQAPSEGLNPDGSRYWRETGVEQRPNGVVCQWTLIRGVNLDGSVEWEEKFWEAAGQFDYKELGSEKSGRDAAGNVWREYWKESMWQEQESGLVHMEKTADKWGKNGIGGEWHEKWWEHYDASGQAEKWAHKWCSIDPNTPLEAGHAHVWHERWGEKYDGQGGSTKYTDKWAERLEGDGWTKWGDKWDENFNQYSQGVKQGEKWWQGKYGEQWNRTWGEQHNGSGWVHKYGKSSCGEHWDTHVQQDTWYERYPHFGFSHCLENSVQLREVRAPHELSPRETP